NTSNVSFPQVDGESVLLHLDLLSICASSGSACTTGLPEPSHVLRAMGRSVHEAQGAVRFSLGRQTTQTHIDQTLAALASTTKKLRRISSS
ncbi:MAG: aminotransferase class V-fold PLP-dependent enzyme, partial [Deltaproteobacteria bacterium]|nr:aminotransferase class V-fold PLP-dependent enzyme [Deltaproteobacteria bacterium]